MNKIKYDDCERCQKCGNKNELYNRYYIDSYLMECDTKCKVCNHKAYWCTGFYMN